MARELLALWATAAYKTAAFLNPDWYYESKPT
jgi:hypothetical protein